MIEPTCNLLHDGIINKLAIHLWYVRTARSQNDFGKYVEYQQQLLSAWKTEVKSRSCRARQLCHDLSATRVFEKTNKTEKRSKSQKTECQP